MSILAAKNQAKRSERIARNLAQATEENAELGLPQPFMLNGVWLVPLGDGHFKPVGPAHWRRPQSKA